MTATLLYRIAAIVFVLFAIGHLWFFESTRTFLPRGAKFMTR